jgi:ABC-type nickel/cobalt efflux system permease component RcnA
MPASDLPPLEPVRDDGVRALQVGLGLWVVAALVLIVRRAELADHGTQWWLAVCGVGLIIGIVEVGIFSRRRALIRERESADPAPSDDPAPNG